MLDSAFEPIYFAETAISGGGRYTVVNNTVDYELRSFGISNSETIARIGDALPGSGFGCESVWCYEASNLDELNWDLVEIDFYGNTGFDVFGDISNVLDPGDDTLNFYRDGDGSLPSGASWDEFLFQDGEPSSQLFVSLEGPGGSTIYASGGTPIPEPSTALLLLGGLAAAAVLGRSR